MRILAAALLLLAACAATPQAGLTPEEAAALDSAAELLGEDGEISNSLTEAELQQYPEARGMPYHVQLFIVQYRTCEHWLGEPAWDAERRRQIEHAVADHCPGIDAVARDLRRGYADNPEVIQRLRGFEPLGQ